MLKDNSAVSSVLATLLLIAIAIVCSVLLYFWIVPLSQVSSPSEIVRGVMKIEAIRLLKSGNRVLAIQVYVRNMGESALVIDSMYVMKKGSSAFQRCSLSKSYKIGVGEVACIKGYPTSTLSPGIYYVKVVSKQGMESVVTVKLTIPSLASKTFLVTVDNTEDNKVTDEDDVAIYKLWVSSDEENYKVWFRVYAKLEVTINYVRAELFDNQGEHPDWVGGNPWERTTPYTYPDWAGAEWTPVREDEFPVTVVITIEKG